MRKLERLLLECSVCGHRAALHVDRLGDPLGEPVTRDNVHHLYDRLFCGECGAAEVRMSDAAGELLVDPESLRACAECGDPIVLPRLEAKPETTLCAECAEE